ncbi:hypothetical protein BZL30_5734 [Mycobacterium kansasii]|uniref:Uncharacterized protein n=2 Tax=Mycobacterium kansasii TaxID=1768 RepID=A0A1V3X0R2_MYCKA|nr:hypothetical protein BZL29_6754 [Mycobacterium kansasii]OOK72416.1 hypothetical protein BZL30_5734 [Mycobacterium kansasii]
MPTAFRGRTLAIDPGATSRSVGAPAPDAFGMTLNDEPAASHRFVVSAVASSRVSQRVQKMSSDESWRSSGRLS